MLKYFMHIDQTSVLLFSVFSVVGTAGVMFLNIILMSTGVLAGLSTIIYNVVKTIIEIKNRNKNKE